MSPSAVTYRFRRPRTADEKRYAWIAEAHDGRRVAIGPDPTRFYRWRGVPLTGSLFATEKRGNNRDAIVRALLLDGF